MQRSRSIAPFALLWLLAGACGGENEGGDKQPDTDSETDGGTIDFSKGALLPLKVGNRWTYRVTDADGVREKVVTVETEEQVGGDGPNAELQAFKLVAERGDEETHSWVGVQEDLTVRYREEVIDTSTGEVETEEYWDPYRIYVDGSEAHHEQDASWLETHEETSTKDGVTETKTVKERWTVISAAERVTVPAGTFDAVVFQKAGTTKLKKYWYVPGIGKVKETGGQTEELSDYELGD